MWARAMVSSFKGKVDSFKGKVRTQLHPLVFRTLGQVKPVAQNLLSWSPWRGNREIEQQKLDLERRKLELEMKARPRGSRVASLGSSGRRTAAKAGFNARAPDYCGETAADYAESGWSSASQRLLRGHDHLWLWIATMAPRRRATGCSLRFSSKWGAS